MPSRAVAMGRLRESSRVWTSEKVRSLVVACFRLIAHSIARWSAEWMMLLTYAHEAMSSAANKPISASERCMKTWPLVTAERGMMQRARDASTALIFSWIKEEAYAGDPRGTQKR